MKTKKYLYFLFFQTLPETNELLNQNLDIIAIHNGMKMCFLQIAYLGN